MLLPLASDFSEGFHAMATIADQSLGIAAITIYEPDCQLSNDWFGETMPRKFGKHTGIEERGVSFEDELTMGFEAVVGLQRETGCNLADCRGLVFVSPSLIPPTVARKFLDPEAARRERPGDVAQRLAERLGLSNCQVRGLNWFCCGYSRALGVVQRHLASRLRLADGEFILVVVANRISRITDYSCSKTGGLFGDMASATLISSLASRRHPVHFEVVHAQADRQPVERPFFYFHIQYDVPVPRPGGLREQVAQRLVYSLDGMGIAETAPRAMSAAVADSLSEAGFSPNELRFVVPHQAGAGIVRFTGMQLEGLGIESELVNGLTRRTGNVSACSVPHALHHEWQRLHGLVACPTAAVGAPGQPEVLQGCVLLRSTPHHDNRASVAA
jgi:3-oxoacyl-[acyl-carrier-protein] synthase III